MYKDKKIIACSPVGRRESMGCLFKQILKNRHIIDEYHLWVNTSVEEDLKFINEYANQNSDFVELKYGCDPLDPEQMGKSYNVKRFYNYCVEPNTFYFKIDDDIIFIEDGTFEKMIQYKVDNPTTFLVYPIIMNNSWCTHFLRKNKAIDVPKCPVHDYTWYADFEKSKEKMKTTDQTLSDDLDEPKLRNFIPEDRVISHLYCFDPHLAYEILNNTYECILENRLTDLDIPNIVLNFEPVSIQFIMWSGEDFAEFDGNVKSLDDEPWLATFYPIKNNLRNSIVGNTRVVHYAHWPHREYLNTTDILEKYERI